MKRRNATIDLMKFVAIYMVILGHCLGRFGLGMALFDHPIGKLIVMSNMPCFLFITGYFSQSVYSKDILTLVKSRYITLLRPNIIYSGIFVFVCTFLLGGLDFSILSAIKELITGVITSYWFIWTVLYATFYSWFFVKIADEFSLNRIAVLFISLIILLLIPNMRYMPDIRFFQYLYIFYILGYISRSSNIRSVIDKYSNKMLFCGFILYLSVSFFYKSDMSFYFFPYTPMPLLLLYYILMIPIGLLGIMVVYLWCRKLQRYLRRDLVDKFSVYGSYSLSIYCIQGIIVGVFDVYHDYLIIENVFLETIVSFIVSVIMISSICFSINILKASQILSKWMLGGVKQ